MKALCCEMTGVWTQAKLLLSQCYTVPNGHTTIMLYLFTPVCYFFAWIESSDVKSAESHIVIKVGLTNAIKKVLVFFTASAIKSLEWKRLYDSIQKIMAAFSTVYLCDEGNNCLENYCFSRFWCEFLWIFRWSCVETRGRLSNLCWLFYFGTSVIYPVDPGFCS